MSSLRLITYSFTDKHSAQVLPVFSQHVDLPQIGFVFSPTSKAPSLCAGGSEKDSVDSFLFGAERSHCQRETWLQSVSCDARERVNLFRLSVC